jgi:hypothetical protein
VNGGVARPIPEVAPVIRTGFPAYAPPLPEGFGAALAPPAPNAIPAVAAAVPPKTVLRFMVALRCSCGADCPALSAI